MLTSKTVRIGAVVALLASSLACADGEGWDETTEVVNTEYGEICVRRAEPPAEPVRVPWEECENDPGHVRTYPHYVNHGAGHRAPPVGDRVNLANGTNVRPTSGTIAAAPPSGGFGTRIATIGG